MYKCTECGCEYQLKPDFCDCGNDSFEVIQQEIAKENPQNDVKPVDLNKTTNIENNFQADNRKGSVLSKPIIEPISFTIFIICLILSFFVIFFAWNPKEQYVSEGETVQQISVKSIPSIDKLWNSQPPVQKVQENTAELKKEEAAKAVPNNIIKVKTVSKPTQKKTIQKNNTTQTKASQKTKVNQTKQPTVVQPVKTQVVQQKPVQPISSSKTDSKQTEQKQTTTSQNDDILKQEQSKRIAEARRELSSYKINLRNTIGRKIDFTKVIGDGSCTVSFKINESGKLINRAFTKQSTNITLNDAVYAAVMSTPSYNPPPNGYNNETLNLNIKFYNGNFEITLN